MGGGTTIHQPTPPPQPSTADAINAYIQGLPQMMQAQMEYAPQLAQQQYDIAQGLAPQYAEQAWQMQQQYAPMMAQQQQELQQQYEPEAYAARQHLGGLMEGDYLTNYDTGGYGQGFDAARSRIQQDSRAAWAQRGLGFSGMSAEDETRMLSEFEFPYALQQEQLRAQELGRRQNMALTLAGRYGVPNVQGVNTPQVQTPNMMGGYDFGGVQSGMQQGYGTYVAGSRPFQTQGTDWLGGAGSIMQGIGSIGSLFASSSQDFKKNITLWN